MIVINVKNNKRMVKLLEITDVRIYLTGGDRATKAFASIVFEDAFVVKDLRVVDGQKGLFVAMPSRKNKEGEYVDICHPINKEMRQVIQDSVLAKFKEETA